MESLTVDLSHRRPGLDGTASEVRHQSPRDRLLRRPQPMETRDGPKTAIQDLRDAGRASGPTSSEEASGAGASAADPQELREAADKVREELEAVSGYRLDIRYSEEDGQYVVKILDAESREVIRQIPAQELLNVSQRIDEVRGILFDEKS